MAEIKKSRRLIRSLDDDFTVLFFTHKTAESEWRSAFKSRRDWVVSTDMSSFSWHMLVVANLLRSRTYLDHATIEGVRNTLVKGLKKEAFNRLKDVLNTTGDELSQVLRIPSRTVARRDVFKPDESERILRVASTFQRAIEVLGSLEKARHWFSSPKRALGEKTPMEFCDTELGADEVCNLLGRIEHGVFS